VAADVWSVTSYKELYTDALETGRWNRLHPPPEQKRPYLQECLQEQDSVVVAASDYVKALPAMVAPWVPGRLIPLGTDGFGRSDTRAALRDYFEVDARFITLAALSGLAQAGKLKRDKVQKAIKDLDIDPEKVSPLSI
jgi:pyruvate dehydrogenase E1 component